jgi:hypothetical protein
MRCGSGYKLLLLYLLLLLNKVPLDVVLLEEMVHPDEVPPLEEVVHLNKVLLNVVQSKPALSMLVESMPVHLDEVPLEGEVPLDVVHLNKVPLVEVPLEEVVYSDEVPPLEEVVQLKEAVRLNKVPLDVVQDKPAQGQLVEDKLGKLHQMEADRVQVRSGPAQSGPTLSNPAQSSPAQSGL